MDLKTYLQGSRGAQTMLARAVGCQSQLMWQWQAGVRAVPADRCAAIERATEGRVTCDDLRPDVRWHRVPDSAWPWHPEGRPLIDVARQSEASAQEVQRVA